MKRDARQIVSAFLGLPLVHTGIIRPGSLVNLTVVQLRPIITAMADQPQADADVLSPTQIGIDPHSLAVAPKFFANRAGIIPVDGNMSIFFGFEIPSNGPLPPEANAPPISVQNFVILSRDKFKQLTEKMNQIVEDMESGRL